MIEKLTKEKELLLKQSPIFNILQDISDMLFKCVESDNNKWHQCFENKGYFLQIGNVNINIIFNARKYNGWHYWVYYDSNLIFECNFDDNRQEFLFKYIPSLKRRQFVIKQTYSTLIYEIILTNISIDLDYINLFNEIYQELSEFIKQENEAKQYNADINNALTNMEIESFERKLSNLVYEVET